MRTATGLPSALLAQRCAPQSEQNAFGEPSGGSYARIASSPEVTRTDPGTTTAWADAAVPVRRWQRVQWQYVAPVGSSSTSKRTAPQRQPPVSGSSATSGRRRLELALADGGDILPAEQEQQRQRGHRDERGAADVRDVEPVHERLA